MCPDLHLLEQLALGLLSGEEAAPLEEHVTSCPKCLQTLIERDPADTVIEALRQAPSTAQRRAAVDQDIERLQAALAGALPIDGAALSLSLEDGWREGRNDGAPLPLPSGEGWGEGREERFDSSASADVANTLDTAPSVSGYSTETPPTEGDAADEREIYDFLAPAQLPDELGRLGTYRVLRVLGTGGMGVVFEAEDPQLKRRVALKAMKPGVAASASARKRFLREAQTAAAVEHDHIVPVYQVGEDRGVPFIAMPLLRGETLAERLERAVAQASSLVSERRQASGVRRQEESVENALGGVPQKGSGFGVQGSGKGEYSLSLWERAGVRAVCSSTIKNQKSKIQNPRLPFQCPNSPASAAKSPSAWRPRTAAG